MTLDATLDATVGDSVVFEFAVRNVGEEPVELQFASGQIADVAVRDGEAKVWCWSDDRLFTQALWSRTLESGESITEQFTWEQPRPGTYTARATLAADREVAATTELTV